MRKSHVNPSFLFKCFATPVLASPDVACAYEVYLSKTSVVQLNYQLDWFLHLWQCMADLEVALAANSAIVNDALDMLCLHSQ
jgi:hypothetical protein